MDFRTNIVTKKVAELLDIQKGSNLLLILGGNRKEKAEGEEQGKRLEPLKEYKTRTSMGEHFRGQGRERSFKARDTQHFTGRLLLYESGFLCLKVTQVPFKEP